MLNFGVNSSVLFSVFYTNNADAFENEHPRMDFAPNVHASLTSKFPNEGWYQCKMRTFKCNYSFKSH